MQNCKVIENIGRRKCIPILYARGTHYEVGFDVGRTFSGLIINFLNQCNVLHCEYLPVYETKIGREIYEKTLINVSRNFPQYIQELQGISTGAKVPFHWLFLMHMDMTIVESSSKTTTKINSNVINGCSTICLNDSGELILGHTEDAFEDVLNHFYIVSAHIISDKPEGKWQVKEEKFTSLCYAGHLPGYTMGYNHHGFVFSVNTLCASKLLPGNTPRHFLTRALLSADNFIMACDILRDRGSGTADGCSINMIFLKQDGNKLFHNAEIAPNYKTNESDINILTISNGECMYHCNKYLRLKIEEIDDVIIPNSQCRMNVFCSFDKPRCKHDVIRMLGDQSDKEHHVFQDCFLKTIAVGIFDCNLKTWSLYADNPKYTDPIVTLPLEID